MAVMRDHGLLKPTKIVLQGIIGSKPTLRKKFRRVSRGYREPAQQITRSFCWYRYPGRKKRRYHVFITNPRKIGRDRKTALDFEVKATGRSVAHVVRDCIDAGIAKSPADTRNTLPYGNASQVGECAGTCDRMCRNSQVAEYTGIRI